MPHLSVVIPSYNSRKTIEECLRAIQASHYNDYELIIVDDHSSDDTVKIASRFADEVIRLSENKGSSNAWKVGMTHATSNIICFIDSDISIKPETIFTIVGFLDRHPEVDAVTGLLAKEHPHRNFFSQYKNLYMNYIFKLLPERVTFLFGSICAIRKEAGSLDKCGMRYSPDTEFGQQLFMHGKTIAFLRELEVIHLKKYTAWSFIKNDFRIPFDWSKIFLRYKGWQQVGRYKTGFAHSPKEQFASVILAPTVFILGVASLFTHHFFLLIFFLILLWLLLNFRFLTFLKAKKGLVFSSLAFLVTFIDNIVMASGILCGMVTTFILNPKRIMLKGR